MVFPPGLVTDLVVGWTHVMVGITVDKPVR